MVTAVVRMAALIRSNLSNCMFGGGIYGICSICGVICCVGSGSGVNDGCVGSSLSHHHYYNYHQPLPSQPAS